MYWGVLIHLLHLIGTIFLGGTTQLDCTCWISSGECSTFHSPLKERWFFQLTSLLPDVSFAYLKRYSTLHIRRYIIHIYIYISSFIHIPKTNEIPNKKVTFWRLPMDKKSVQHGHIMASLEVPERCLCSRRGRASGGAFARVVGPFGHRGHRHPGKEPRERKRVVFWVVHRGVLGI